MTMTANQLPLHSGRLRSEVVGLEAIYAIDIRPRARWT